MVDEVLFASVISLHEISLATILRAGAGCFHRAVSVAFSITVELVRVLA